jgi:putative sterol carrier protein
MMAAEMDEFHDELGERRHVRLLERTSGTVLVELEDDGRTERWYVNVRRGDVTLSKSMPKGASRPDCVLRTKASTFKAIRTGELNLVAAVLRGLLSIEGKVALAVALQGLFRPSVGAAGEAVAGYARRPQ